MCGITGYINLNDEPVQSTETVLKMLRVQKHRGPDDSGIRVFNLKKGTSAELPANELSRIENDYNGILGFNRLSILDLSQNGHQPMVSPDGKVFLTLNGEIYNAFDHTDELAAWGYHFKSTTDTEIVLALYLKYGIDGMLERLNGMFAIAVVDLKLRKIFLARDRFGIKPLYYIYNKDILAFSSELKSFGYLPRFTFRIEEKHLDEFMIFRNNLNDTLFKDIQVLKPGYYLTYAYNEGLQKQCFFNLNNYRRENNSSADINYYREELKEWLSKSVRRQLMSDVKLGCQLSGGIDSSLVTWFANNNHQRGNFEAVSIIFNDKRFNEEQYINRVTCELGITSHKFLLDSDYYFDHIEKAAWHLEAPINHPNTVAIYKLSQQAKEHVTVLLSGEGADEVFGGYSRFYEITYPFQSRRFLHEVKKGLKEPLGFIKYLNNEYRAVMATAFMTPGLAHKLRKDFIFKRAVNERLELYRTISGSSFDRQVKYEMYSYLPDLLIRQDKMSMAHTIENRVPFLDNEVVENSFRIPEKLLQIRKSPEGYNTEKYLLKKVTAELFGNEFAFRNKMGFGIPVREFFSNPRFIEYLKDKILPLMRQRGLFNHNLATQWLSDIENLRYNQLEALWVIVSFEIWANVYIDGKYENWNTRF
ncbi:MAG: asparagine synthase (glutamine-hydrolyzing) [Bacteroidales bacterium]|nr:asparagine synthase (glutamine-hydrolyzing) [Bacteroidales bacterium]